MMKGRMKKGWTWLLIVCMLTLLIPTALAETDSPKPSKQVEQGETAQPNEDEPQTPTNLYQSRAGENHLNVESYYQDDVDAINAIIEKNGLSAVKDDPKNWDFVYWSDASPKRITDLFLNKEGLTGNLNVSGLTLLLYFDCSDNQLSGLDVGGLVELKSLNCRGNQLTDLNVSGLAKLQSLNCSENPLTELKVNGLVALTYLHCEQTAITKLDLSGLPEHIDVSGNLDQLTDLSGHTLTVGKTENGFAKIHHYDGSEKQVELQAYPKAGYTFTGWDDGKTDNPIWFALNQTATITPVFTRETKPVYHEGDMAFLETYITDHQLSGKRGIVLGYPNTYPASWQEDNVATTDKRITSLYLYDFNLTGSLDVSGLTALDYLDCHDNQLTSLNVSGLAALQSLNCHGNRLAGRLDASGLMRLQDLDCSDNQLTGLDVSGCTALKNLYCYENNLTSLKLGTLPVLNELICHTNALSSLDVNQCPKLTDLSCEFNQITRLELSECTNLTNLGCEGNELTSLSLEKLTNLEYFNGKHNRFTRLDLQGLFKLDSVLTLRNPTLRTLVSPEGQTFTLLEANNGFAAITSYYPSEKEIWVQALPKTGYVFQRWSGDADGTANPLMMTLDRDKTITPMFQTETNPVYHPDDVAKIEEVITDHHLNGKAGIELGYASTYGFLVRWQDDTVPTYKRITSFHISVMKLKGELRIAGLPELTQLDCAYNELTSLNLHDLPKLESLYCVNNALTSLDVSGFTALNHMDCEENPITRLKLPGGKSVTIQVTGGEGAPWLESFDYRFGLPWGMYSAKPSPGYGKQTWSGLRGCEPYLADGSKMQFDFRKNGQADVSAELSFARTYALTAEESQAQITGDGLFDGMEVKKGETFTFTASPVTTGASIPFSGDVQLVPVKWQTNPEGDFATGYTQSFSTKGMSLGAHVLTVTYEKQAYDGSRWTTIGTLERKLSYTLAEKGAASPAETGQGGKGGNPITGDAGYIWWLLGLALTGGILAAASFKRKVSQGKEK